MECEAALLVLVLMNHRHWNLIINFIDMDSIIIKKIMEFILRVKLIFKINFVITNVMFLPRGQGSKLIKTFALPPLPYFLGVCSHMVVNNSSLLMSNLLCPRRCIWERDYVSRMK
jgi:hypothetical protein